MPPPTDKELDRIQKQYFKGEQTKKVRDELLRTTKIQVEVPAPTVLEGGITLESLFEPPPAIQDVSLDEYAAKYPGERHDLTCGECGAALMVLRESAKYRRPFYGCSTFPACLGTHGAHPDGRPLGTPTNKETKKCRIRAHAVFDEIWKQTLVRNRGAAYTWMRKVMNLSDAEAHIGAFSKEQCERLVGLVYRDYPTLQDRYAALVYGEDPFEDDLLDPA